MLTEYWTKRRPQMEVLIAEYDAGKRPNDRITANKYKRTLRLLDAKLKGEHTMEEWIALKGEFHYRCVRCLCACRDDRGDWLVKDHITPIYQGGSDSLENIQPLCPRCNASKGPENFNWKEYRRSNGMD